MTKARSKTRKASIVRNKVRGDVATEFKEEDRKIDVLVRVRDEDKESIENLRRLIINPGDPKPLPLEAVADLKVNEGPSEIRRIDQQRTAVVTANISGRDLGSISEDIYRILQGTKMPDDFTFDIAGQNKEMETSLNSMMLALGLAIFLVYIVMASQFESLIHPFIIIFDPDGHDRCADISLCIPHSGQYCRFSGRYHARRYCRQ